MCSCATVILQCVTVNDSVATWCVTVILQWLYFYKTLQWQYINTVQLCSINSKCINNNQNKHSTKLNSYQSTQSMFFLTQLKNVSQIHPRPTLKRLPYITAFKKKKKKSLFQIDYFSITEVKSSSKGCTWHRLTHYLQYVNKCI